MSQIWPRARKRDRGQHLFKCKLQQLLHISSQKTTAPLTVFLCFHWENTPVCRQHCHRSPTHPINSHGAMLILHHDHMHRHWWRNTSKREKEKLQTGSCSMLKCADGDRKSIGRRCGALWTASSCRRDADVTVLMQTQGQIVWLSAFRTSQHVSAAALKQAVGLQRHKI